MTKTQFLSLHGFLFNYIKQVVLNFDFKKNKYSFGFIDFFVCIFDKFFKISWN